MMSREQRAYLTIMVDSIRNKNDLLSNILDATKEQGSLLQITPVDYQKFNKLIKDKDLWIKQIDEIDEGFHAIYKRLEGDIAEYKYECKEVILSMQDLIRQVTEKNMYIQALEKKNSISFKLYMSQEKKQLRNKKMSSQIATNYYKNFAKQNVGMQSIFLDKKK